jgi:hypothetical protein
MCAAPRDALMKLSLGKDFSAAPTSSSPPATKSQVVLRACSLKNLRDFRDIRSEFDKLTAGQTSELEHRNVSAGALRREIAAILEATSSQSPFLAAPDVAQLIGRFQTTTMQA